MEMQNRKLLSGHYSIRRLKQGECIKSDLSSHNYILSTKRTIFVYWLFGKQETL